LSRFEFKIAELESKVATLSIRPYDVEKLAAAKKMTDGYTSNQRDLLRYILTHGNPTLFTIAKSTRLEQWIGRMLSLWNTGVSWSATHRRTLPKASTGSLLLPLGSRS
jgi:hypothetical protein